MATRTIPSSTAIPPLHTRLLYPNPTPPPPRPPAKHRIPTVPAALPLLNQPFTFPIWTSPSLTPTSTSSSPTSGPIARVTILKDSLTRASRGVALDQFVFAPDACKAAGEFEGKILNSRKIRASIVKDNGRVAGFIRKRVYKDKSRCYECGEHLSCECPKNVLGPRERPVPKKGRMDEMTGEEEILTTARRGMSKYLRRKVGHPQWTAGRRRGY